MESAQQLEVRRCAKPRHVLTAEGNLLAVPSGWDLLPPGDAALSRRVKAAGPSWTVIEVKGRKRFSHGIWAPAEILRRLQTEREAEQEDPEYQRRLESGRARRARQESVYADDFLAAVRQFLAFHPRYQTVEMEMARRIAEHATPVGSGTVARTRRIPLEERAEAAVIAWMRHQTTAYDSLSIPRIAGARRDVRRQLAQRSRELLARYRSAAPFALELCPLHRALLHRSRT